MKKDNVVLHELSLTAADVVAVVGLFFFGEIVLSRAAISYACS